MTGGSCLMQIGAAVPETTTAGIMTCEDATWVGVLQQHLQQFGQNLERKHEVISPRMNMTTARKK